MIKMIILIILPIDRNWLSYYGIEELTLTYPIETVRGRYGGGVRMADWYFQDRPKLTPKQTALLKRLAIGLHGEDLDEMNRILTHFAS